MGVTQDIQMLQAEPSGSNTGGSTFSTSLINIPWEMRGNMLGVFCRHPSGARLKGDSHHPEDYIIPLTASHFQLQQAPKAGE